VVIEYKSPGLLAVDRNIQQTYYQLSNYLAEEQMRSGAALLAGVAFDGERLFFIHYRATAKPLMHGPYPFDIEAAKTLLIYLRALARLALTPENLAEKFGPRSELAPKAVSALFGSLKHWGSPKVQTFFNEWRRLFGIIYGEQFGIQQEREAQDLAVLYGIDAKEDFQEILFSVHTYFAFLMKLIAAELLSLREAFRTSPVLELLHIPSRELRLRLQDMEDGGIYARKGITNFLEGDFFRWYLEAWSPALEDALRNIARTLSEFEPATSTLEPATARDLLKKLYQYLVPQQVRHRLGEYYTPDWLAELVLNEVGYRGQSNKRLLDPACGSGTFLVLAIQRAKEHGKHREGLPELEIAKRVKENIWGFDLNPLAVIAARTNYLFAMGELVDALIQKGGVLEIPVYLCDSVLTPTRVSGDLLGEVLKVNTSVGEFHVPAHWVKDRGLLLSRAVPILEEMVRNQYSTEEAMERFRKEGLAFGRNQEVVQQFYERLLQLEQQSRNGIWARFLKNAFAPMMAGKFDFVVGNPPWVRWEYLSKEYRKETKSMWDAYGLSTIKESRDMLSKGKRDFSMLFTYVSSDYYLKNGAKLGFLITQEVFKSKGSGEGFRRFQLGEGASLKLLKVHDLTPVKPFEGAANKTAAIFLKKGEKTMYPVPYILWTKTKRTKGITTDKPLKEISRILNKEKMLARPVASFVSSLRNYKSEESSLVYGENFYRAKIGARTEPYGIFWLTITNVLADGNLLVQNMTKGRRKKKIRPQEAKIESSLVFPSVRGADVYRWGIKSTIDVLIVHDPMYPTIPISMSKMRLYYPLTYSYLSGFRQELLAREAYKTFHREAKRPFYAQFNISQDTFSNYKVVWKRMSNDIFAAVVSEIRTKYNYKTVIPLDTTSFFPSNSESEAHYLCAIINSRPVRDFIKSFSSAGRGFGTPSVMQHVGIPKFDPKDTLHMRLAALSMKSHLLKAQGKDKEIQTHEKEIDRLVVELFKKSSK